MTEEHRRAIDYYFSIPENYQAFVGLLGGIKGKNVLNIFDEKGSDLAHFLGDNGADVTAIDLRKTLRQEFGLPYGEYFDLVLCQEFPVNMEFQISEINRVLKPEGRYLSDEGSPRERQELVRNGFRDLKKICNGAYFYARKP